MSSISDDFKLRELLDNAVYSAIGNIDANLKGLPKAISKIVVDYLEEIPSFGESEWRALFGRVDPAPPLPHDFSDTWNGPCPIYSGKKVSETHILVYIPATVNGEPFTLKKLGEIAKRFFPKNDSGYRYWSSIDDELGNKSIKSCWVLMTKDVLVRSRNKSYAYQKKIIARLAKKSLGYKVPGTLEAATCILTQFFDSKKRLFNDDPWTYTRCKEKVHGYHTIVGGFAPSGLCLSDSDYNNENIGVAAMKIIGSY